MYVCTWCSNKKKKKRFCFANMGIDMKGQLTFCLAFYATNPSFLCLCHLSLLCVPKACFEKS